MLEKLAEASGGIIIGVFFLLVNFPGGTIFMALGCNTRRLDGWDWVLSVIIPAYGLFKGLSSNACLDMF